MPGFFFAIPIAATIALLGPATAQERDAQNDRGLAASCAACHGTDGRSPAGSALPALAGMNRDRLRDAMQAFRSGTRTGTVMPQIAKGYDDARIERLARYFASQR